MPKTKMRKRSKAGASSSRRVVSIRPGRSIHPPAIRSNMQVRHKYRFQCNAQGSYPISSADILGACGGICTVSNSTIVGFFASFRIRRIEAWAFASTTPTLLPATISINWNGTPDFVSNQEISDTSFSSDYPAYVSCRPPRNTNAAFWQTTSSENMFNITIPDNSIVDLELDLVVSDQQDVATFTGLTTATLGAQYYLALDGHASNELVPISLNTTS
jgi:hypothetical protein